MDDKKLSPEELETLRIAARDAYYLHCQVEITNRKYDTAFQVLGKAKEREADALRSYKKAIFWNLVGVIWCICLVVMWILG
ncbi:hypothetical protein [Neisseria yangbaofengii]|uniref:hypothetical protein n=1 Tax=Neisseria yangbaofengii TaxID=2709396 RepID=UPI0013EA9843|nr:hypothetical protein [Neisseria yangbaofengii]